MQQNININEVDRPLTISLLVFFYVSLLSIYKICSIKFTSRNKFSSDVLFWPVSKSCFVFSPTPLKLLHGILYNCVGNYDTILVLMCTLHGKSVFQYFSRYSSRLNSELWSYIEYRSEQLVSGIPLNRCLNFVDI